MSDTPISDVPTPPTSAPAPAGPVMVPLTVVQEERQRAQAARAEADALKARLAELEPDATRWRDHTVAEAKRLDEANAAALAGLPEAARLALSKLDRDNLAAALSAYGTIAAAQPIPTPEPPRHPVGGGVQQSAVSPMELTHIERAWVESARPDLRDVSPASVKAMFAKFGPKGQK